MGYGSSGSVGPKTRVSSCYRRNFRFCLSQGTAADFGRMRNAHILLITMRALANEVAKNLVLAGIGSLTVLDPDSVTEDDLGGQFFIGEEHVGMNVCF